MKKIVVIETTDFLRIQLEKLLTHFGYGNAELLSGLLRNSIMHTFLNADLIIMDLDNYSLDIVDLIKRIRLTDKISQVPIILLSGQSDLKTLKLAIQAGCSDFITKPINNEILMQKIHRALKRTAENFMSENIVSKTSPVDSSTLTKLTWNDAYRLGIEEIDREHKAIFDNYEKLYDHMKQGHGHDYYNEVLRFMSEYMTQHFEHEEAFHLRMNYENRLEHKALHDDFKRQVKSFIESAGHEAPQNQDLIRLNLFLKNWIMHHILIEDRKVGESLGTKA